VQKNDLCIRIDDASQISESRRRIVALARRLSFSESECSNAAIVATEVGTNLIKHGGGGEILVGAIEGSQPCLQLIATDKGKGTDDTIKCLKDGYSTAGTPGTGLGAIKRLSSDFDFYSYPNGGTVLYSVMRGPHPAPPGMTAAIGLPKPGETECGDNWYKREFPESHVIVLADGLGHGPDAARASAVAIETLQRAPSDSPDEILQLIHNAMRNTRGGAVSVVRIMKASNKVSVSGLGNISTVLASPTKQQSLMSMNGTAGLVASRIKVYDYEPVSNSFLIMHSDGLTNRWELNNFPQVWKCHAGIVAGLLSRDFRRTTDDATVVVTRLEKIE